MKRRLEGTLGGLLVVATVAACTTTHTAAPSSPATTPPPPTTAGLQPGPHSAIADVDLPEGTIQCTRDSSSGCGITLSDPHEEYWHYSAPYDDVVAFLRTRFATGRRYDAHGATWWNGLPPCYDKGHQSPPWGHTFAGAAGATEWVWSDGAKKLVVSVMGSGSIEIFEDFGPDLTECYRA